MPTIGIIAIALLGIYWLSRGSVSLSPRRSIKMAPVMIYCGDCEKIVPLAEQANGDDCCYTCGGNAWVLSAYAGRPSNVLEFETRKWAREYITERRRRCMR